MNGNNKDTNNIEEKNETYKIETSDNYNGIIELTNELQKRIENLISVSRQIKELHSNSKNKKERFEHTIDEYKKMIHELAQPLAVIIGRCELLSMSGNIKPEIKNNLNQIMSSANKLSVIVRKIQSLNKSVIQQFDEDLSKNDFSKLLI